MAALCMYQLLSAIGKNSDRPLSRLKEQFEREYGLDGRKGDLEGSAILERATEEETSIIDRILDRDT